VGLTADDRFELIELIHRLCHALDYSRPADFAAVPGPWPAPVTRAVFPDRLTVGRR
jgi:hypothetical protein